MNIDNLSDEEKSVHLVKAMGKYEDVALLQVVDALVDGDRKHYWQHNGEICLIPNLYEVDENGDPLYMVLAWRVLNWGLGPHTQGTHRVIFPQIAAFLYREKRVFTLSPATAQRLWLDKILSLCIEAGLVEIQATRS
jgi:hypothetical protein